ncbi:hypothetical protein FJ414_17735 [Mesorhizobium sp. B3-1-6]|uniref:hypothetical protein n=1 Tax=unclassified Mesorhizobium TaxID=325217 RepID=UPI00112CB61A|nr:MULTISPECIES: hypothetical protein [unclassified Mesorhizobium]TPI35528.1 hypothetical protein FJ414_17735 [Mesorhizobium sp. B3-1-6]UCI28231.1 hypothetical protein FJ430_11800 [Mesorhizobium sp. B2-8-5]
MKIVADVIDKLKEDQMNDPPEVQDFVVEDVLELTDYSEYGAVVTIVDVGGRRVRLHVSIIRGELLCERIADALECRYGT